MMTLSNLRFIIAEVDCSLQWLIVMFHVVILPLMYSAFTCDLAIKLSLWSFVRLDGFLLVFGVLMVVFCGVARKVRRFLALVPAIQGVTGASISNDRREAGDITRLALWEKIRDNFFPFG